MKNLMVWAILLGVMVVGIGYHYSVRQDMAQIEQAEVIPSPKPPAAEPRYPIEAVPAPAPESDAGLAVSSEQPLPEPPAAKLILPTLADSDQFVRSAAVSLIGESALDQWFVTDYLVSRLVATVDSLDGRRVAPAMRPIVPIAGRFLVLGQAQDAALSPANAARYAPYVELIEAVDMADLIRYYRDYYPLFQEAYLGLGYEDVYFNDRLVAILDHLLVTPLPQGPAALRQNEAVYEFVAPELEAMSVGQKALYRLGPDQGQRMRARLQLLRDGVATAADS